MPEGNELHRFAELQSALFTGRKVTVAAPNGRFTQGAAHLDGRKLKTIDAFGKHLFYDFGRGRQLHVSLTKLRELPELLQANLRRLVSIFEPPPL